MQSKAFKLRIKKHALKPHSIIIIHTCFSFRNHGDINYKFHLKLCRLGEKTEVGSSKNMGIDKHRKKTIDHMSNQN